MIDQVDAWYELVSKVPVRGLRWIKFDHYPDTVALVANSFQPLDKCSLDTGKRNPQSTTVLLGSVLKRRFYRHPNAISETTLNSTTIRLPMFRIAALILLL